MIDRKKHLPFGWFIEDTGDHGLTPFRVGCPGRSHTGFTMGGARRFAWEQATEEQKAIAELEAAAEVVRKFRRATEGPRATMNLGQGETQGALLAIRTIALEAVGLLDTAGIVEGFEVLDTLEDYAAGDMASACPEG